MKGEQSNLSTGRVGNREARVIEDDGARGGVGPGTRKDRQSTVQGNKSQQKKLKGKGGMETSTNNSLSRLSSIPRGSHRSGVALAPRLLLVLLVWMGRRAVVRRAEVTIQGVVARRSRRGAGCGSMDGASRKAYEGRLPNLGWVRIQNGHHCECVGRHYEGVEG